MIPWIRCCIVSGLLSLVAVPGWAERESRSLRVFSPITHRTQVADDVTSLLQLATSRYKAGDLDGAIETATKVLSLPGQARNKVALSIRAQAYFDKTATNRTDTTSLANAIKDYDVLITLDPKDATFVRNRGLFYVSLKQYDKAVLDFDRLTVLTPKDADAYNLKGRCYLLMTPPQYARAVEVFTTYLLWRPDDGVAKLHRGLAYYYLEQWDNAIRDLEGVSDDALARTHHRITSDLPGLLADAYTQKSDAPANIKYQYHAATRYNSAKRLPEADPNRKRWLNEALNNWDKVIVLEPKNERTFYYRGLTYRVLNDPAHAVTDFVHAFDLKPSFDAANEAAQMYLELGIPLRDSDPDKAFDLFDKAVDFYGKAVTVADKSVTASTIGTAYYNLGIALWEKARAAEYKTKAEPDGPIYTQAAAAFEKYLQMIPNAPDRDTVTEYIKHLKEKAVP